MPYEFHERESELEPEPSSSRGGVPPSKWTAAGVLDPPGPPKRPVGPIPAVPTSWFMRILAILLLVGVGGAIALLLRSLL
ncbi:MAG TPA: hypothetical protein VLV88_03730 [Terriglobales bacterium]|nr:hypothetical protein [Terriglobales bacterium]